MKWLLTGGSGFTGSYLIPEILKRFPGDEILIVDINPPNFSFTNNCQFLRVDLLDQVKITNIISQEKPNRIIHLIGVMRNENPHFMTKINVVTCGNLLEAVVSTNVDLDGFLVIGSAAQYGIASPDTPPSENDPCTPLSYYGHSKNLQEHLAMEYFHNFNIPIICVRPANIFGPKMSSLFVIPKILTQMVTSKKLLGKQKIEIAISYLNAGRDFIDIRDVVDAYIHLLMSPKTRGEVFNLGTNNLTYLNTVIEIGKEILEIEDLEVIEENPQHEDDLHLTDSRKIQRLIKWKLKRDLHTTIRDMIDNYSKELDNK
jgi:nucleoside-diphosphate-sugar epimerase